MKDARRVTLHDVAEELGLSVTQTSRALNDHWDVAEKTKAEARAAAAKLGYVPNIEARKLKMGSARAESIGLILPQAELRFTDAFFAELLSGIVEEAAHAKHELRLNASLGGADDVDPYRRAIATRQVDGFVVVRVEAEDERIRDLSDAAFPFVAFGRAMDRADYSYVDDADDVMRPIVDHLVEFGHTRIGCLAEPAQFARARRRMASLVAALRAHGLELEEELVAGAEFHEDTGYEGAKQLLEASDPPSAIVAFNDLLALGALGAARDLGLVVPTDVSITGFDDVPAGRFATPGLTTIRRDGREIGRTLCRQLLDRISGDETVPRHVELGSDLVVRGSTDPAQI